MTCCSTRWFARSVDEERRERTERTCFSANLPLVIEFANTGSVGVTAEAITIASSLIKNWRRREVRLSRRERRGKERK